MEGADLNLSLVFYSVCRLFRRERCRCRIFTSLHHKMLLFFSVSSCRLSVVWKKDCRLILRSCRLSTKPLGRPPSSASCLARKMYIENHGAMVVLSKIQPIQKFTVAWGNKIQDDCSAWLKVMTFPRFEPWSSRYLLEDKQVHYQYAIMEHAFADWLDCGMNLLAVLW